MNNDIKTTELIRTSQTWDGVQLPDFPKGKPELTVLRMTFPVGAVTGWHPSLICSTSPNPVKY